MTAARYFDVEVEGPITVVKFTEPYLNDSNIHELGPELARLADPPGRGELHLDFSAVTYLSSSVLAKLFALHKRITADGGRFVLTNLAAVYDLFSVARLDTVMELHTKEATPQRPPAAPSP
jgi:anti-anti-sigma factor